MSFYLIKLLGYYKDVIWVTEETLSHLVCSYKIIVAIKPKE